MRNAMTRVLGFAALAGCASHPPPTEHLAASIAEVRGAQTAGAEQLPLAELHVKLAEDQIAQARKMIERGENERADAMTIRAYNDAALALALTREAKLKSELETLASAHPNVEAPQNVSPSLEATDPPGPSMPPGDPDRAADD
jgi:outer membrane protein TolC